jgi:diacylglycerol kinase (ATP)
VALVVNPRAGRGRAARLVEPVRVALGPGADVLVGSSGAESVALAREAVAGGVDAVVAMGGDGLVHCVVQAVAGTGVPLGIVPAGGGNDLAGALGIPADPRRAVEVVAAGRTRDIDLGRTDSGTWWAGVLNAGFDSQVVARAERMRHPPGSTRYDLAAYVEILHLRHHRMRITLDGVTTEQPVTLVAVGNSPRYGGGMHIAPGARLDDGVFEVVVADALSRATLVRLKPLVRAGTHVRHPRVHVHRAAAVTLDAPDLPAYADGESLGVLPVTTTCVRGAMRVLVPA